MQQFLSGATAMGYLTAALFFFTCWRRTRDRFFAFFALSFGMLALNRVGLSTAAHSVNNATHYFTRLGAYSLILIAIVQKNRAGRSGGASSSEQRKAA